MGSKYPQFNKFNHADVDNHILLDMRTVARMTMQISSVWIEEWADHDYGPRSWFPEGRFGFPITTLYDVINWWASDNFVVFLRYVEERKAAKNRKWSNSKWFDANQHLLTRNEP